MAMRRCGGSAKGGRASREHEILKRRAYSTFQLRYQHRKDDASSFRSKVEDDILTSQPKI
jgi:hypothetical protein